MNSLNINQQLNELSRISISKFISKIHNIDDYYRFDIGLPRIKFKDIIKEPLDSIICNLCMDYSQTKGVYELRQTISRLIQKDRNVDYDPEEILISCGSLGGLYVALKALINPGDKVIVPTPSWATYENLIKINSGVMETIKLDLDSEYLSMDFHAQLKSIKGTVKVIIINNPHNPTGMMYSPELINEIIDYATKNDIYIFFDESYQQITYNRELVSNVKYPKQPNVIYFRTFSKYYGMPGLRLGYIFGNKEIIDVINKVNHIVVGNISKIDQYIGLKLLTSSNTIFQHRVDNYNKWIKYASKLFNDVQPEMKVMNNKGTFYLFIRLPNRLDSNVLCNELIEKYKTIVLPGNIFGEDYYDYIRLSLTDDDEKIEAGLKNIVDCVVTMS